MRTKQVCLALAVVGIVSLTAASADDEVVQYPEPDPPSMASDARAGVRLAPRTGRRVLTFYTTPRGGPASDAALRTMSKVIEETVTNTGLENWQSPGRGLGAFGGLDIFDPFVKAQYIPTVGAVFTIPVSFPIKEPPAPPEEEEPAIEGEDLWEKHSASSALAPTTSDLERLIAIDMPQRREDSGVGPFTLRQEGPAYEARKVQKLREAVISAVARYGHHMKQVDESERILVVIEAPSWVRLAAPPDDAHHIVHYRAGGLPYLFRSGARDRLLITVNKSDVVSATTYADLADKAEEIQY